MQGLQTHLQMCCCLLGLVELICEWAWLRECAACLCMESVHYCMCACTHTRRWCYGHSAEGVPLPHLIVVPLSTAPNWLREFQAWAPQLNVVAFSGNRVRSL